MRENQSNDFMKITVEQTVKIIDAMKILDKTGKKIVFILEGRTLKAALTDGDIRRHILRGGSLEDGVLQAANINPKFIHPDAFSEAQTLMDRHGIESLPVVNERMEFISVVFHHENSIVNMGRIQLPVIIMAGGKGTRLYPYTKILPKPLIPVGDQPILEHIIERFYAYGCNSFYLILNHKKNMIKSYFSDLEKEYCIEYIDEDKPLGTGGGLSLLKGRIHETAFVSNCDILIEANYEDIYSVHKNNGNLITMICAFKHITVPYGVIHTGEGGSILSMDEKPEFTFMVNTGMYLVEPRVIDEMPEDTPVSFPDIVEKYRLAGEKVAIYPIGEKAWMDMGQIEELEEMRNRMGV